MSGNKEHHRRWAGVKTFTIASNHVFYQENIQIRYKDLPLTHEPPDGAYFTLHGLTTDHFIWLFYVACRAIGKNDMRWIPVSAVPLFDAIVGDEYVWEQGTS